MKHLDCKLYYQQLHLKYLCNLARYWLQTAWGWHDSVETCSSVIICEIIVHLLVIVQNKKNDSSSSWTVWYMKIEAAQSFETPGTLTQWHGVITAEDLNSRESGCSHSTLVSRASVIVATCVRHPVGTGNCHYVLMTFENTAGVVFWILDARIPLQRRV